MSMEFDLQTNTIRKDGRVIAKIECVDSRAEKDIDDMFNFVNNYDYWVEFKRDEALELHDEIIDCGDEGISNDLEHKLLKFLSNCYCEPWEWSLNEKKGNEI